MTMHWVEINIKERKNKCNDKCKTTYYSYPNDCYLYNLGF